MCISLKRVSIPLHIKDCFPEILSERTETDYRSPVLRRKTGGPTRREKSAETNLDWKPNGHTAPYQVSNQRSTSTEEVPLRNLLPYRHAVWRYLSESVRNAL